MDRWLLLSISCVALVTLGCQANRQAGLDPFNGAQRVPPPGTGAVGTNPDPYLSGSSAAPAAGAPGGGGFWGTSGAAAPAGPVAPTAPVNPWPTTAGTPPPAWNGAPAANHTSPSWWPSSWFNSNPSAAPPPASYPPNTYPPAAYPSGYPGNPAYRGAQLPPPTNVLPATYNAPQPQSSGSSMGWRTATPYEAPPAAANP